MREGRSSQTRAPRVGPIVELGPQVSFIPEQVLYGSQ